MVDSVQVVGSVMASDLEHGSIDHPADPQAAGAEHEGHETDHPVGQRGAPDPVEILGATDGDEQTETGW